MKKIYILTAVFALLTLSLNAQNSQYATKNVQQRVDKSKDACKALDERLRDINSGAKDAPADAVSAPYYNSFDTSDERGQMGTYDANGDASSSSNYGKWGYFYSDDTQSNIEARYVYHSTNTANDYIFIAVPITLQAGKHYRFSMDVTTGGYTERYEVVMFDELTTTSITSGTQIIPVTTTSSTTTTRIQSDPITVTQESYMYFAVHCVSEADQYYLAIDNIAIEAEDADDLSVAISAPESIAAGGTATVTATVTNNGTDAVQGYTVLIKANGNVISTQTVTTSLAAGASATYTAQYATTSANAGETVNFEVEVVYTDDDPSNNTAATTMYVLPTPPPENVAATGNENSGTMTWDAPIIGLVPGTLIWDFEEASDLAAFTTIDSDGDGYNWSWHYNTGSGNYTVHGGSGVAYSESFHNNDDGETGVALSPDNWMISPEVTLGGTLSFWTAHQATYPENFAVYVCVGSYSNPASDFVKISPDITTTATMTQYTYDLSQYSGQGYFAFRHYNVQDMFILLIDDISIQTMVPGEQPTSYNIYLDGVLVDNVPSTTFSYTFNNVSGEHQCAVSAVYSYGESVAVPATFSTLPKTATPTITYEIVGNNMVITATGDGTVHLEADGQTAEGQGSAVITIPLGDNERTVTATATAQETGKLVSDPATETIVIPEVGRSPMPNITMTNNGDGTYTITVTGTGEISVYIDDAEHSGTAGDPIATGNGSVSFTVEEHSREMTITVQATNQEGDLAISRTAEQTYTIPAMTIDDGFKLLDPQPANADTPIDLSKIMFVDRFSVDIPSNNSHPFKYEYTLEETQVRQRSSNSVDVYAEHTGSNGKGFYTLSQIDNDTTASLVMNVRNAAMDFNLSELSAPFFYTVEREEEADGETYWGWNAVLQRTSVGNYKQTLKYDTKGNLLYNYNDTIFPGEHIQLDLDTITGSYNDYNAYVPVVWTMGFDRVNYNEDDPVHNSYGASVWTTGVAEVTMDTENAPLARVQRGWNTKWSDNNGEKCSLFMLDNVWATATMPTVNTLDYEPYMFRIFVKSKENKLRPYKYVEKDGNTVITAGEGTTNGPICVWNGYINDPDNAHKGVEISYTPGDEDHGMTITFNKNRVIREDANDDWTLSDENAMFGALESIAVSGYDSNGDPVLHDISTDDLEVFVRFYYIVEGIAEGHTPWAPTRDGNGDGEGPAGYGAESDPGGAGVATSVSEVRYHGEVVSKTYYNVQGIKSEQPFSGVNIVVTRYSDGATVVTKVMK